MTVLNYLDLSTGHLTHDTCNRWALGSPWPVVSNYERGLVVGVPDKQVIKESEVEIPNDLLHVIDHARNLGCTLILFDAGGDVSDELPYFEW